MEKHDLYNYPVSNGKPDREAVDVLITRIKEQNVMFLEHFGRINVGLGCIVIPETGEVVTFVSLQCGLAYDELGDYPGTPFEGPLGAYGVGQ
jgi:hypothetical protein